MVALAGDLTVDAAGRRVGRLSSGAPAALAVAVEDAIDGPKALIVTAPPAFSVRMTAAKAVWFENVSAMAAPIAADPELVVSPEAVVFAVAVVDAAIVAASLGATPVPAASCAVLLTLLIASATAAAMLTPPPDAPVFASVMSVLVVVALMESAKRPVRIAPAPISAREPMFAMLRATDAPRPKLDPLPPPLVPGSAFEVLVEFVVALSVTLPACAVRLVPARPQRSC